MKRLALAAILSAAPLAAFAQSFTAVNELQVIPLSGASFR